MKKSVFIIHTEYHLLFALKMILSFCNTREDKCLIYRLSPAGTKRLNQDLNFENTDIEYNQIIYNNYNFQAKDLRCKIDEIISLRPDVLYVFNQAQKVYPYLFKKIKKTGCRIVLCPDGAYVYCNHTPIKERLNQFIFGNVFLWSNNFPSFLPFPQKHYAYHKEIDDVVVEDLKAYRNYTKKNIICLEERNYSKDAFISIVNHIFRFNSSDIKVPVGSILWIDQPVDGMEESKRRFLVDLKNMFPERMIFIKPHPHSFPSEIKTLGDIGGFQILNLNIPVELLMENLKEVNIISAFSTAMFYNNPTCRYFWVSPLFKELPAEYVKLVTFEHIKVVNSLEKLDI